MLISGVGQKRAEAGTQARGGMGRNTSNTGRLNSRKKRLVPMSSPMGMPINWAKMKPRPIRIKLLPQSPQYAGSTNDSLKALRTALGGGIALRMGRPYLVPNSQMSRNTMIEKHPRKADLSLRNLWGFLPGLPFVDFLGGADISDFPS